VCRASTGQHVHGSRQTTDTRCTYLSNLLLTSSSSHWKFCRFCTHSKKLTTTPERHMTGT
jgi:hypothetical protein